MHQKLHMISSEKNIAWKRARSHRLGGRKEIDNAGVGCVMSQHRIYFMPRDTELLACFVM